MPQDVPAADAPTLLAEMADRLGNSPLDGALAQCAEIVQAGFQENFQRAEDASGAAWPPRKDPTPQHPLLQLTGALMASTQEGNPGNVTVFDSRTLTTGVDRSVRLGGIPGAATHQFGYPPRNIPPRQYHYATDDVLADCLEIVADKSADKVFAP